MITTQQVALHGHSFTVRTGGDGPVILLLHGMAGSGETWDRIMPLLAGEFTVVAPDLLGHGDSAKPREGEYSLGTHANIVRDLLVALGHERATFVGHSFGGGVALQLAYQFPERCERLVLVGSGGLGREVNPLLRALSLPGAEWVLPVVCSPLLRETGERVAGWLARTGMRAAPTVEEIWRSYASLVDEAGRRAFFGTLRAVIDRDGQAVSARDRMHLAAHVPTLICWGRDDGIIPVRHALTTHAAIPGSRLELFDGVGHYPHCEVAGRFAHVLRDFIATTIPVRHSEAWWRDVLCATAPAEARA
jgi:pimeloyl-ACP methyl ester carboxylesterase